MVSFNDPFLSRLILVGMWISKSPYVVANIPPPPPPGVPQLGNGQSYQRPRPPSIHDNPMKTAGNVNGKPPPPPPSQDVKDKVDEEKEEYSEQIMSRKEAEDFIKNFDIEKSKSSRNKISNRPPPPIIQEKDESDSKQSLKSFVENSERKITDGSVHNEVRKIGIPPPPQINQQLDVNDVIENDSFEMSNKEVDSNKVDSIEDQEWIVPKDMQFRAEPVKMGDPLESEEEVLAPLVENREPTVYPRTYPQRPLQHQKPPNSIAPRNYNYHERNQQSQQTLHRRNQMQPLPPQQMQQQRYPNSQQQDGFSPQDRMMLKPQSQGHRPMPPRQYANQNVGSGALIPHRSQTPQRRGMGFGQSIFQKVGQSLDALSDVDGMIAQRAQNVLKTVSSSSDSIAGGVSNVMRKTVFTSLDSVTGIKENIKDQVRGRMSNIFGGAPTSASEARDEWEDDRRRTVTENRRRAILGTSRVSGDEHEGGSSFEDSPLHQVLYGTAPEIQTDEYGQDVNSEEGKQDIQDWDHSDPRKSSFEECSDETLNDDNQIESNPFAILAYPASSNLDEDDSSDIEDVDNDLVDPTTIFIQSETRSPRTRTQTPATFDFEDEPTSIMQKFAGLFQLPKLPSFGKRSKSDFDLSGWDDDDGWELKPQKKVIQNRREIGQVLKKSSSSVNSVKELLERYESSSSLAKKSTTNLVTNAEIRQLRRLGKSKAVFDLLAVGFLYLTVTELFRLYGTSFNMQQWIVPRSMDDFSMTLRQISSTFGISDSSFFGSWAPYGIVAFFLANCNGHVFIQPKILELSKKLSIQVESIVVYSQLFLRSMSGIPCDQSLQKIAADSATKQCTAIVEIARLRSFVSFAAMAIFLSSVAFVKPILVGFATAMFQFAKMSELRKIPLEWDIIGKKFKEIISQLGSMTLSLLNEEIKGLQSNPMSMISSASMIFSLIILSQMPLFERIGTIKSRNFVDKNVSNLLQIVSNLGGSSATRLSLQIQGDSVKKMISQIQSMLVSSKKRDPSIETEKTILFLRFLAYVLVSTIICGAPVAVHAFVTSINGQGVGAETVGVAILMIWAMRLVQNAMKNAIFSTNISSSARLGSFLHNIANTMREIEITSRQGNPNSSPSSLTKGIEVSDLWAAHSGKRAWGCRGVNFTCKAGEVVVVLGEGSSGKTKLLTTVAEMVVSPPQIAKTTNVARGKVSIGGVDVQNWNQTQLRGKVGIFLNDAKTLDCMSQVHSRQMLKEILRPEAPSASNNSAVESAVQIANQFIDMANIIAKLPEKLETRITCNEEDLLLDPKLTLLSSSEWSKVLLTKLLAQVIMSNENPMASPSSLSKSLVGSVLLLDDVTTNFDEITEAKLIKSLKNAGVATIITSKRWSVGRYASRIIVMKDGSIIESGTHSELMAKGADNSIYADQWSKMMSN